MIDFNYDPMSEEEAQRERYKMLEDGIYKGVIESAKVEAAKSTGNPQIVLGLRVWDRDGNPKELKDWVTLSRNMIWKLRHLCESCGLIKEFEDKTFKPDLCEGKSVMVKIKMRPASEIPFDKLNGKEPGSMYPAKNVIDDYVVTAHTNHTQHTSQNDSKGHADLQFDNDMDLPF